MAKGDVRIQDLGGLSAPSVRRFPINAGSTATYAGEPVMIKLEVNAIASYVIPLTDALPTTASYFVGIAASDGTHTASADGYIDVYLDQPGIVYACKQKNSALSQTEIDDGTFKRYTFDLTSSTYTVDDLTADAITAGLIIVGGNPDTREWYFTVAEDCTWRNIVHGVANV